MGDRHRSLDHGARVIARKIRGRRLSNYCVCREHKGLISLESNIITLIYQVCTKCAACNSTPLCVRSITKKTNDTPPSSRLLKPSTGEGSQALFAMERHQQKSSVQSTRHVCIPNTAKCSIKVLLTSHYRVCNFYPSTKAMLHAP